MSEEKLAFEELNIAIGQRVEFLAQQESENKAFSEAIVLGAIPGESLIVTVDDIDVAAKIVEGQNIVLRIGLAEGIAVFLARVLYITEDPLYMAFVDLPKQVSFKRIRKAPRVFVAIPVLLSNLTSSNIAGVAGQIRDISTAGVRLECSEPIGVIGESVSMKGKFTVGSLKRVTSIKGIIRSVNTTQAGFDYGLEFVEEDENELIALFGFVFDAMSHGKIDSIG